MKPWETLDQATAPDGTPLVLARRGDELVIRAGGQVLMSNRQHGSEEALARAACGHLRSRPNARLLIGGLGMGFTTRAALDLLGRDARVVIAELVPAVVRWNREVLAPLAGHPLADARVEVVEGDVLAVMRRAPRAFDAIALDVDNGPAALTAATNQSLYGDKGLAAARRALVPGGVYVVWSAAGDPRFENRLEQAGFRARSEFVPVRSARGSARHVLFIGESRG